MFTLPTVEDPENIAALLNPTCAVIEVHVSYLQPQLTIIAGVWRSAEAYAAKKKHATTLQLGLSPKDTEEWLNRKRGQITSLEQEIAELEQLCLKYILQKD